MLSKKEWIKIEQEYVKGDISLRELAKKYNVSDETMFKHSIANNWVEKRDKRLAKLQQKLGEKDENEIEKEAIRLAQRNKDRAAIFRFVQGILTVELNKLGDKQEKGGVVDVKDVLDIVKSLREAIVGERLEEGQPITIKESRIAPKPKLTPEEQKLVEKALKLGGLDDDNEPD